MLLGGKILHLPRLMMTVLACLGTGKPVDLA